MSRLVLAALLVGCTGEPTPAEPVQLGSVLIEELYYSGAVPNGGTDHYFSDQFIELANTTDAPLDLSGMMIGDAYGAAGEINAGMEPDSYVERRPDQVVLSSVWRFPEGARLEPGQTLVVAHDGTNHRPFSTIDLSGAAFETYVEASGRDDDHPTVPNMESVLFNGGSDWLITVFGPSVVVVEADTELGSVSGGDLASVPVDAVLDGVEALMDGDSGAFKRLPPSVDAGFLWVSDPYVGRSLQRKRDGDGWIDTDDTSQDFERGDPDPGQPPASDGVYGDPWIELGTGYTAFETLTDGDDIELVAGNQGGWHLDASVRFGGFGPGGVLLVYEAFDTEANRVSYTTQASLVESSVLEVDDAWHRVGDRVVMDISDPNQVVGTELIVRVTAELDGQTWSDERRVMVVDAE